MSALNSKGIVKNNLSALVFLVLLAVVVLPVAYADYLDAGASHYTNYSSNVTVRGCIKLDNGSGVNNVNMTGILNSSNFSIVSDSSGCFVFNLTSPNSTGYYNVSLSTNTSVIKNISVYISNVSSVVINFTSTKPPFANGSSFLANVSFKGTLTITPTLDIFNPNSGISSGWTISNLTPRTNANSILYNITVPSNAEGRYVMEFENGAGATVLFVKSSVIAVANTQDSANSTTTSFGQGETVVVVGKVRDDSGPIITASVTAFITSPNSTVVNITLTHSPETNGTYNGTFSGTTLPGEYTIEIVANTSTRVVRSTSSITVQKLEGVLDIVKDFFFDFGSASSFRAGGPVEFNALVYNLSADTLLNGSLAGGGSNVNCTSISVTQFKNTLNGSTVSSPTLTRSVSLFLGQNVCKIRFTAPSSDGIYSITVNTSVGEGAATTVLATGYFSVQSYIMKPNPVSSIGGGNEFLTFLMPNDNATFEISVRNLSSNGAALAGNSITNFNVTKITPMSFTGGGQSDITNIQVLEYTNGTATANPKLKIAVPENRTGPHIIEFKATVAGSTIIGSSFYFARYVEGFIFPGSFGGGFGAGHDGGGFEGGSFRCSGVQNFTARIYDVRTRQAARNVAFNSIQEAREELTGKSVASSLSIVSSTSTDSNGVGNVTLNFTGAMSGFHFMLINITTNDGKSDSLPGGFECRQLSFFPQLQALGSSGTGGFFVAPASGINVTLSGIRNLNTGAQVSNGTVNILRLESFDPTKGPKFIPGLSSTFLLSNGAAQFTLFPANFSGLSGKWFNGFNNFRIQVCDNSTSPQTCDTGFGGFMVVAFDAFQDFMAGAFQTSLVTGTNVTYNIMARTNVTNFTVQIGMPWEGSLVDATVVNFSLKSDGWNNTGHTGFDNFEKWNVTFTVPSNLRKGGNMITIKVYNYLNETTDIMTFGTAATLSISVPDMEGVFPSEYFIEANVSSAANVSTFLSTYSVNLTTINTTFNVNSKSGRVCVGRTFNTTRFGFMSQTVVYSNLTNTTFIVMDNLTANNYDTLIVSVNGGTQIGVVHAGNRSLASAGFGYLYFMKLDGCEFGSVSNAQINGTGFGSGFGGQHQVNTVAQIPFIVRRGSTAKVNVTIDVFQLVQQEDFGGGRGGFGFTGTLPASNYVATQATTDSNGMAFLRLNVSRAGLYSIIWNFTDGATSDTGDFSEGIPIEIKALRTEGGILTGNHPSTFRSITFVKNSTETRNATIPNSPIYSAVWNESSSGVLLNDGTNYYHYMALRNVTQLIPGVPYTAIPGGAFTEIVLDNDGNLNTSSMDGGGDPFGPLYGNFTDTFGSDQPTQRNIMGDKFTVDGTLTVDENTIRILIANPNSFFNTYIFNTGSSLRMNVNVTVRACAFTFSRPSKPVIGANVSSLITRSFTSSGPPTTENLTMYNPFTGTSVASLLTGPSGCATFNVSRTNGWTAGFSNEIKASITSSGSTEQFTVGSVSVGCPQSVPCY